VHSGLILKLENQGRDT